MSHLEQRRRSYPVASLIRDSLNPFLESILAAAVRRWPLAWGLLHLAGFTWGGWLSTSGPMTGSLPFDPPMTWLSRFSALIPLTLALGKRDKGGLVWAAVFLLSLASGFQEGIIRNGRQAAIAEQPWSPATRVLHEGKAVVRISGWPGRGSRDKWRAPARLVHWSSASKVIGNEPPARGEGLMLQGSGLPPEPGALLGGKLGVWVPPVAPVPGGFDYRSFLTGRGIRWQGKIEDVRLLEKPDIVAGLAGNVLVPVRSWILDRLALLLPTHEADLAAAVLLGRRTPGSRETSRPFANLGLAHLFSVSGLHVGILLGIFLLPAMLTKASATWRVMPLAIILPIYILLTGIPGSVVRASGLGFLGLAAVLAGRRADPLYLVGLLFWAGSLWDPIQNLDPGLRLSYLAAGGIIAIGRKAEQSGLMGKGWKKRLVAVLAVSLAAQWFTLNQVASSFGRISLLSTPANFLAVPLFGVALWATVLAVVFSAVFPWAGEALAGWSWLIMRFLGGSVDWASEATGGWSIGLAVPGPGKIIIHILLSLGLFLFLSTRIGPYTASNWIRRGAILLIMTLGFLGAAPWGADLRRVAGPTVWQFDVGQGDCSWIIFPDKWSCLVDTGGRFGFGADPNGPLSRSLLPFLERSGVNRLDSVILTHGHLDHTGGMAALTKSISVADVYFGGRANSCLDGLPLSGEVLSPLAGTIIHQWKQWSLEILYPASPLPVGMSENNRSLVVGLKHKNRYVMVFSGDLETEGEDLWAQSGGVPEGVQVWKAGHHGSDTSGSRELLKILRPHLVLLSCGVGNRYKHPSHGPYLANRDTLDIWRTDLSGTIRLQWDENGKLSCFNKHRAIREGALTPG